ncbi:hypothetical protein PTSG_02476 [Salpingoeca rosetta]|uniref:Uncharacterized protein n=1 Tax=Salpingoeca rosetta (strain ATCC 50818 / BSB-021) TaxID=946362 RepID=F2U2B1_SALR5|nr:uncharacterized protein PTSG_02476 [Salpingoeca rosetta]EGD81763.1 hypothetical protein PTSG_02476 [Salpingoeca rosetta]|eukprot:XP_004996967.1 hypothetical protein PTSG_02476 [Salpingoeca rosetta]
MAGRRTAWHDGGDGNRDRTEEATQKTNATPAAAKAAPVAVGKVAGVPLPPSTPPRERSGSGRWRRRSTKTTAKDSNSSSRATSATTTPHAATTPSATQRKQHHHTPRRATSATTTPASALGRSRSRIPRRASSESLHLHTTNEPIDEGDLHMSSMSVARAPHTNSLQPEQNMFVFASMPRTPPGGERRPEPGKTGSKTMAGLDDRLLELKSEYATRTSPRTSRPRSGNRPRSGQRRPAPAVWSPTTSPSSTTKSVRLQTDDDEHNPVADDVDDDDEGRAHDHRHAALPPPSLSFSMADDGTEDGVGEGAARDLAPAAAGTTTSINVQDNQDRDASDEEVVVTRLQSLQVKDKELTAPDTEDLGDGDRSDRHVDAADGDGGDRIAAGGGTDDATPREHNADSRDDGDMDSDSDASPPPTLNLAGFVVADDTFLQDESWRHASDSDEDSASDDDFVVTQPVDEFDEEEENMPDGTPLPALLAGRGGGGGGGDDDDDVDLSSVVDATRKALHQLTDAEKTPTPPRRARNGPRPTTATTAATAAAKRTPFHAHTSRHDAHALLSWMANANGSNDTTLRRDSLAWGSMSNLTLTSTGTPMPDGLMLDQQTWGHEFGGDSDGALRWSPEPVFDLYSQQHSTSHLPIADEGAEGYEDWGVEERGEELGEDEGRGGWRMEDGSAHTRVHGVEGDAETAGEEALASTREEMARLIEGTHVRPTDGRTEQQQQPQGMEPHHQQQQHQRHTSARTRRHTRRSATGSESDAVTGEGAGDDGQMELIYDPSLNCYFSPSTGDYFQLA